MERPDIKLGDEARDKITGFKGVVIGITDWISGCRRAGLQSEGLHDGKPIDPQWSDIELLEVVKPEAALVSSPSGGPESTPPRSTDPSR